MDFSYGPRYAEEFDRFPPGPPVSPQFYGAQPAPSFRPMAPSYRGHESMAGHTYYEPAYRPGPRGGSPGPGPRYAQDYPMSPQHSRHYSGYSHSPPRSNHARRHSSFFGAGDIGPDEDLIHTDEGYIVTPNRRAGARTTMPSRPREQSFSNVAYQTYEEPARSSRREPQYMPESRDDYYERRPLQRREEPARPATTRPSGSGRSKKQPPKDLTPKHPRATAEDAQAHGIPSNYSLKYWDPREEPILLLGSVFDADSLGRWIYDWVVYHHGPAHALADTAGDLWLLLIQLAGKVKQLQEVAMCVRDAKKKAVVDDFLTAGERLHAKLGKILKGCEAPMLKKKKEAGTLSLVAGVEFVLCLFGRDRQLDRTERFMNAIRLFNQRFESSCGPIVLDPTA